MGELLAAIIAGLAYGMPLFVVASGLTLTFGVMHVLNFAHAAFLMLGAYTFVTLLGGDADRLVVFLVGATAAGLVIAAIGMFSEVAVFRRLYREDHIVTLLASFALLLALEGVTTAIWGLGARTKAPVPELRGSLSIAGSRVPTYDLFLVGVGALVAVGLFLLLSRTQYGMRLRAVAHDELMARALGVRARRIQLSVFALGAGLAGFAGALMGPLISIDPSLASTYVIESFAVVIIGGMGSISGALLAALLIGLSESLLVSFAPGLAGFSLYVAVTVVLLLRPEGLMGQYSLSRG